MAKLLLADAPLLHVPEVGILQKDKGIRDLYLEGGVQKWASRGVQVKTYRSPEEGGVLSPGRDWGRRHMGSLCMALHVHPKEWGFRRQYPACPCCAPWRPGVPCTESRGSGVFLKKTGHREKG